MRLFSLWYLIVLLVSSSAMAEGGKIIGTAGLTQIEGAGGGGLTPWATIAGYDTRDEFSASAFTTRVNVDDYRFTASGVAVGLFDRVELSYARHTFDLTTLGGDIKQDVIGAKVRLYGDVVYSTWPQVALGMQYKKLDDGSVAKLVGATESDSGQDYYLAMTKVHLGAALGYNVVWNATLRATKANQIGLLGYGGTRNSDYEVMAEGSLGILLSQHLAIGVEYREKPNNLGLGETAWRDVFVAYIPNKSVNFTLAYADLGSIAGAQHQQGLYVSITGYLW